MLTKLITGDEFSGENFEWIENAENVIAEINKKYSNLNTAKAKLNAVIVFIRDFLEADDLYARALEMYKNERDKINEELLRRTNQNAKSERDEAGWQDWEDILKLRPKIKEPLERIVFDLYTTVDPRRLEYRNMRIGTSPFESGNTLVMGTPMKIVLKSYKGADGKGEYEVSIPSALKANINKYIKKNNLNVEDYFFPYGLQTPSGFSRYISSMFEKHSGIRTTETILRKSHESWAQQNDKNYQDKEDRAIRKGTSVKQLDTSYTKT